MDVLARAIGHTLLAVSAFTILAHGRTGSQAKQSQAWTARLMHHDGGRWLAGVLVLVAAVTFEPSKARGLDAALRSLRDAPAGPAILSVVAVGLVLFGLFGFCEARWRRT